MNGQTESQTRRQEAASWFSRLGDKHVSVSDLEAFSAWRRDPLNAAAYQRLEEVWDATQTLAGDQDIEALVARAGAPESRSVSRPRWAVIRQPAWGAALALLLIVGVALYGWRQSGGETYRSEVGERRELVLADGSRLVLDTRSLVRVRLDGDARQVWLDQGQARFVVASSDRPFIVHAADAEVTALGTAFDVRLDGGRTRVTLLEGAVEVRTEGNAASPVRLSPGDQVLAVREISRPVRVDLSRATSWTEGRLVFDGTPLETAIAEVNRYRRQPIRLDAPALARTPVSGLFDADDPDGFVAAVTSLYGLDAMPAPDGSLSLRPKGPPGDTSS
jgi:transmembrane sensor